MANNSAVKPVIDVDVLIGLIQKVNDPKKATEWTPVYRDLLKENPGLWRHVGDLAHQTTLALIKNAQGSVAFTESIRQGLEELKAELGYDSAPALEKLLIEQVLVTWLRLSLLEKGAATRHTVGVFEFARPTEAQDKRIAQALRSFTHACTTLARVRKLAQRTPEIMQINFGAQQVNLVKGEVDTPAASD